LPASLRGSASSLTTNFGAPALQLRAAGPEYRGEIQRPRRHHGRPDLRYAVRVRPRERRGVNDPRYRQQHALDVLRTELVATDVDQPVGPPDDEETPVGGDVAGVARVEPAVAKDLRRCFRIAEVRRRAGLAANADLPLGSRRRRAILVIDRLDLDDG
jgi:hypothetical protein